LAGPRNRIIVDERAVDLDPFGEEIELEGYDRNLSVTLRNQPRIFLLIFTPIRTYLQNLSCPRTRARDPVQTQAGWAAFGPILFNPFLFLFQWDFGNLLKIVEKS
jgi:hypothetical protein